MVFRVQLAMALITLFPPPRKGATDDGDEPFLGPNKLAEKFIFIIDVLPVKVTAGG